MRRHRTIGWMAAAALSSVAMLALATPLEAIALGDQKVRIDGLLREWPGRLDKLSHVAQGSSRGKDPQAEGVIGYDAKNLYVAMKVRDAKLVRTSGFGTGEDYGSLLLAFPRGNGYRSYEVRLYAGRTGKSAGAVKLAGASQIQGAKIVEAPSKDGYTLEASIPWSTFREAKKLRAGLRAALRYHDADAPGSVRTVIATSPAKAGASLPPLLLEGEQGLYQNLIRAKGLREKPDRVLVGDVAGDSQQEVVAVYGGYLTIVGASYRAGKEFFFQELGVPGGSAIERFELRDLTADGKDEIVLVKRVGEQKTYRSVLQVFSVSKGAEAPFVAFQHEVGIVTEESSIKNKLSVEGTGKNAAITIAQGEVDNVDPASYSELLPGDMESALLPWQNIKSRTYRWDGKRFEKGQEKSWEPKMAEPGVRTAQGSAGQTLDTGASGPPPPPPPRPPSPDELLDRLYALYRKERAVGAAKPRFDFVTDVAGDPSTERILVHKKDIVVFGSGFKGGTSYAFITIGVENDKDVLDATARDLTGDGKAEIVVRAVLNAKASEQLGGDVVERHAYFVYKVTESGIKRVFAAELGRSLQGNSIIGSVRFLPQKRGFELELLPGRAIGWTEESYPFPIDRHPYGGLEPLLVPWGGEASRRYAFRGEAFVQK